MNKNNNLNIAKSAKNDEFYTLLDDVEKEMGFYISQFKDKIIYCNCDSIHSSFVNYFSINFSFLGLKKLIASSYNKDGKGSMYIYDGVNIQNKELNGNGDFRSNECIELLKEADIVVTNPPFSLFREFFALMMEYNKQFIILGNMNAISYKEIFPYFRNGKLWLGKSIHSGDREFLVPNDYPLNAKGFRIAENGEKFIRVKGIRWFTNVPFNKFVDNQVLYKTYTEEEYPKYDNYDAINVNKVAEIPYDYNGAIGVPITIIDKLCTDGLIHFDTPMLEQQNSKYQIINANDYRTNEKVPLKQHGLIKDKDSVINSKPVYARVLIKKVNE